MRLRSPCGSTFGCMGQGRSVTTVTRERKLPVSGGVSRIALKSQKKTGVTTVTRHFPRARYMRARACARMIAIHVFPVSLLSQEKNLMKSVSYATRDPTHQLFATVSGPLIASVFSALPDTYAKKGVFDGSP